MPDHQNTEGADQQDRAEAAHTVNFFKPTSSHAKANMRLISVLVVIWAIAVFGFQILLTAIQKPTQEQALRQFNEVWPSIKSGSATPEDQRVFARDMLMVLGKNVVVKDPDKKVLSTALSATVQGLLPESDRSRYLGLVGQEENSEAAELASNAIGLEDTGLDKLMIQLLPFYLRKADDSAISPEVAERLPAIMNLYLTHNQSLLTDIQFLGFPFHYWYTAQFLLIMFVLLCLIYAVLIDKIHKKHNFVEE